MSIPDLLRMVPGMDVAQINSSTWAISARGFNFQFASKLLVLIDGRAANKPLFGGVNWDTPDVPLEDIERIEVMRGPGGAVWGANATNGVINIISKKAEDNFGDWRRWNAGAGVKDDSVLMVGVSEHFVREGGMIGFCLEVKKSRFEINLATTQKTKLKISSRLRALAKSVISAQGGN